MEKEKTQKYVELQLLDQQIRNIQKQLQLVENQIIELIITRQGLDELGEVKVNSETLAPLASGIFIKADIKDKDNLIVNVGSNVAVEKTREEVKELINKQLDEVKKVQNELLFQLQSLSIEAQKIEKDLKNV